MAKTNYVSNITLPHHKDSLFWQAAYRQSMQAAETLYQMERNRKGNGLQRDCLWQGFYACRTQAENYIEHARSDGLLLTMFFPD